MPGLQGHFAAMPLKDLVAYLGERRASGLLRVRRGSVQKQVQLLDGHVVGARSNQYHEYLGQFLVNLGLLTELQFEQAYATRKETHVPLGRILVMIGLVTEDDVRQALGLKLRETLLEAFTWSEGEFSYDMDARPEEEQDITTSVALRDIHREGVQREEEWSALRALFPSGAVRLGVDAQRLGEPPPPDSLEAQLLQRVGPGRTLQEVLRTLRAPQFMLYQRLAALHRQGALRVEGSASPPPAPPDEEEVLLGVAMEDAEPSVGELIQTARSLLTQGDLRSGEALARRAHELADTPETTAVLRAAESALLGALRRELLARPLVPSPRVGTAQLRALKLQEPELYLLSRVDGQRPLDTIIRSPLQSLPELEALKALQDFAEQGLIELAPAPAP